MSDLDEKLREVLKSRSLGEYVQTEEGVFTRVNWENSPLLNKYVEEIKNAFADAGYIQSQDLLNLHANMKAEYTRLAMSPSPRPKDEPYVIGDKNILRTGTHGCLMCHKCDSACPLCKTCKCYKKNKSGIA